MIGRLTNRYSQPLAGLRFTQPMGTLFASQPVSVKNFFLRLLLISSVACGVSVVQGQSAYEPYTFIRLAGDTGHGGNVDGVSVLARFYYPGGVAVDGKGNVYVADIQNSAIRKITAGGIVSTLAGGIAGGSTDGAGRLAQFYYPEGVAVDRAGNVYVADTQNQTIRKITAAGVVTTLAGAAGVIGSADGTGSAARFWIPRGVAVDSAENVYVADCINNTIRKITPDGVVSTLAGLAGNAGSADGAGSAARFNNPYGVAVDQAGNVYVADSLNSAIRKITSGGVVSTLAGLPGNYGSADGPGSTARFFQPDGVAVDCAGNVYVTDCNNETIRKITSEGVVRTLAGLTFSPGSTDGPGSVARFFLPYGVAVDQAGNVYVGDMGNYTIRRGFPNDDPLANDIRIGVRLP
jgi:sugar lactone lactonase YvrE